MIASSKSNRYERIHKQLQDLVSPDLPSASRMATIAALLYHKINYYFWTGFYLLSEDRLLVGPYQGSLACIELPRGQGVCWEAIGRGETVIVPDVHQFPGHIACDSRSQSEIVVPLRDRSSTIYGVLDVDSDKLNSFDSVDREWLERIVLILND